MASKQDWNTIEMGMPMDVSVIEERKARARAWFERLRDDILREL